MQQTTSEIPSLSDINIIDRAADERRLIIFLGAGISCAVGLPPWDKVKSDLIDTVRLSPDADENTKDQLRNMDIYACFERIYRMDRTIYEHILNQSLCTSDENVDKFKMLLRALKSLNPVSIVTTNVDDLLLDCGVLKRNQFRYMEECAPQELRDDKVFCLHGNREKHVFNSYDTKLYDSSDFRNFLNNLFGSYCVLFIGFSFRDRKLLECAELNREFARRPENDSYVAHVALLPSNHKGRPFLELEQQYGIYVLEYDNADDSYTNFEKTILSWQRGQTPGSEI